MFWNRISVETAAVDISWTPVKSKMTLRIRFFPRISLHAAPSTGAPQSSILLSLHYVPSRTISRACGAALLSSIRLRWHAT